MDMDDESADRSVAAASSDDVQELAALVARTEGVQPWRRVLHAASGLTLAFLPPALGLGRPLTVALLSGGVVLLVVADLARLRVPGLNALFFRTLTPLASPREARNLASSTWFAVGGLLAWGLWPAAIASPALSVLALADPAASVVGRLFGRGRLGKGSVQGSTTFLLTAFLVLSPQVGFAAAAIAAVATTFAEVLPLRLDDNLVVPVACGAVLWGLGFLAA